MTCCEKCKYRLYTIIGICPFWKDGPGVYLTGESHCCEGWILYEGNRSSSRIERFKEFQEIAKFDSFMKE